MSTFAKSFMDEVCRLNRKGAKAGVRTLHKQFGGAITLVAAALLVFTTGCISPIARTTRLTATPFAPVTKEVTVYPKGEAGPANYEVIGVVTAIQIMRPGDRETIMKQLQGDAAAMGADSLVGYFTDSDGAGGIWTTALAARTIPVGQKPTPRSVAGVVAIPHPIMPKEVATEKRAETLEDIAFKLAQYQLILKGYYPILIDEPTPEPFEGTFQRMDVNGLNKYGGPDADLILGTRFLKNQGFNLALVSYQDISLEMTLYSKPQKKATWHKTSVGWIMGGLVQSLGPFAEKARGMLDPLMTEAFKELPVLAK